VSSTFLKAPSPKVGSSHKIDRRWTYENRIGRAFSPHTLTPNEIHMFIEFTTRAGRESGDERDFPGEKRGKKILQLAAAGRECRIRFPDPPRRSWKRKRCPSASAQICFHIHATLLYLHSTSLMSAICRVLASCIVLRYESSKNNTDIVTAGETLLRQACHFFYMCDIAC
jgi:hypothetical protein